VTQGQTHQTPPGTRRKLWGTSTLLARMRSTTLGNTSSEKNAGHAQRQPSRCQPPYPYTRPRTLSMVSTRSRIQLHLSRSGMCMYCVRSSVQRNGQYRSGRGGVGPLLGCHRTGMPAWHYRFLQSNACTLINSEALQPPPRITGACGAVSRDARFTDRGLKTLHVPLAGDPGANDNGHNILDAVGMRPYSTFAEGRVLSWVLK
jgi:hypothetical protein